MFDRFVEFMDYDVFTRIMAVICSLLTLILISLVVIKVYWILLYSLIMGALVSILMLVFKCPMSYALMIGLAISLLVAIGSILMLKYPEDVNVGKTTVAEDSLDDNNKPSS